MIQPGQKTHRREPVLESY